MNIRAAGYSNVIDSIIYPEISSLLCSALLLAVHVPWRPISQCSAERGETGGSALFLHGHESASEPPLVVNRHQTAAQCSPGRPLLHPDSTVCKQYSDRCRSPALHCTRRPRKSLVKTFSRLSKRLKKRNSDQQQKEEQSHE
ncbi:hypothetical protein GUJ93_ZPchr0014g47436 [Zizania palustris]|uniref:Uncharacterized protein n=1 Tax=Zizania palustris TaxID=103762 RepID=A0A8J5W0G4_ZIZPA|nr:hypothetical protein GUJ93_ZPchr0014g47436 [Zizania palustris]